MSSHLHRGVGVGLASLVTLPAIGAKTGGIKEQWRVVENFSELSQLSA